MYKNKRGWNISCPFNLAITTVLCSILFLLLPAITNEPPQHYSKKYNTQPSHSRKDGVDWKNNQYKIHNDPKY